MKHQKDENPMTKHWFETWFDTEYYHQLYKHRDENEARQFIDALLIFLKPKPKTKFLDVACGKGRHSIQINASGYDVSGFDLSANSINAASQFSNETLRFFIHDMRQALPMADFDIALNLFTSFGYFESKEEHIQSLYNIYQCLNPNGIFVLDYLNKSSIQSGFNQLQNVQTGSLAFEIFKTIEENKFVKKIRVNDMGSELDFEERVMAFSKSELVQMVKEVGFSVTHTHGNYNLDSYSDDAPRVIIIAKK